jgi:capsular polysaccharide transport system permease protein
MTDTVEVKKPTQVAEPKPQNKEKPSTEAVSQADKKVTSEKTVKPQSRVKKQPLKAKIKAALERKNLHFLTSIPAFNKFCMRHYKRMVKVSRKKSFFVIVGLPWLLVATYYLFFAANFYVSSASFMIKDASNQGVSAGAGITLAAIAGFSSQNDEHILNEHIISVGMLQYLDDAVQLKAHFSEHPDADWVSRLSPDASLEDFLAYYQDQLKIYYNELSGLLSVEVKSYDPAYSQRMLEAILERSESLVNDKSKELAAAQLRFVQEEVQASADRLVEARQALIKFQDSNKLFNPEQQGQTVSGIISGLEGELATAEAEKRRLLSYQRNDSPNVIALKGKIDSLKAQIAHESKRLVKGDNQNKQTINKVYGDYKELELEVEVAQMTYMSALTALEGARIEASRQLKHLFVINEPFAAEEAMYPRKFYNLLTLFVILVLAFGIFRMVATTIKEHLD